MHHEEADVIIIGSGPAGLQAGKALISLGTRVLILEKESRPGGKLLKWDSLFPFGEDPAQVLSTLIDGLVPCLRTSAEVVSHSYSGGMHHMETRGGYSCSANALVLATGFQPFDARLKEEYGYGIYENVITSVDLEKMFSTGRVSTKGGQIPGRVAMVHCVGSRDLKAGHEYCSSVCCITGIKQAMKLCSLYPSVRVHHLYMDLRLGGRFHESCYKEAQVKYRIRFIRGRLSETNPGPGETLEIRYEDTLAGKPARMTVDLLVLLVGMVPEPVKCFNEILHTGADGFYGDGSISGGFAWNGTPGNGFPGNETPGKEIPEKGTPGKGISPDANYGHKSTGKIHNGDGDFRNGSAGPSGSTARSSLFCAGACTGPKNLVQSLQEASAVALEVNSYLRNIPQYERLYQDHGIRI
jgi:heterodisulfide reductase subunit A